MTTKAVVASVPTVAASCIAEERFKECKAEVGTSALTNEVERVVIFSGGFCVDEFEGYQENGCGKRTVDITANKERCAVVNNHDSSSAVPEDALP